MRASRAFLPIILVMGLFSGLKAQSSLSIYVEAAPGIQTMEEREAVLTSGFQFALMPQAGIRIAYEMWEGIQLRGGIHYLAKGARVPVVADPINYPDAPAGKGFVILRANYLAISAGAMGLVPVNAGIRLGGWLDFSGGYFLYGTSRNTLYDRDHPNYKFDLNTFFNNSYLAIHLGGALAIAIGDNMEFLVLPGLELQLNNAYRSQVFIPRFVGLSPGFGLRIGLGK